MRETPSRQAQEPRAEEAVHEEHDYSGEALVLTEHREIAVEVVLRGYFEPIDGRYHWYGRLRPNDEITELAASRKVQVVLRTPAGEAVGTLSEPDPWDRYRVLGVGRPPFLIDTSLTDTSPVDTSPTDMSPVDAGPEETAPDSSGPNSTGPEPVG